MGILKNLFFSRKFLFLSLNIPLLLIILVLVFSTFLSINPNYGTKLIDRFFITDFKIEYSSITSDGAILHPNLKFTNLKLLKGDEILGKTDSLHISISILDSLLSGKTVIQKVVINNGMIYSSKAEDGSSDFLTINSDISFNKNNLISGHIDFIQNNVAGSLFLSSDKGVQKYLINLPNNNWLSFIPISIDNSLRNIKFSLKMIGDNKYNSLNSLGYFDISGKESDILNFSAIKGKFIQSFKDNISLVSFQDLSKNLFANENLLSIDLTNKIIRLSELNFDHNIAQIRSLESIEKIQLTNLTYVFDKRESFFSAAFKSLNLRDIYLDSIEDLSGIILANSNLLQLKIRPNQVTLRTHDGSPFSFMPHGNSSYNFIDKILDTKLLLTNNKANIELEMLNYPNGAYNLKVLAKDIGTKLFLSLFPKNLIEVKTNLVNSIKFDSLDNVQLSIKNGFLDESLNDLEGSIKSTNFDYKINPSQIINSDLIDLRLKNSNINIALSDGLFNSIPFKAGKVLIDTSAETLNYFSEHLLSSNNIKFEGLNITNYLIEKDIVVPFKSVGKINLSNQDSINLTKLSFKNLNIKIFEENQLKDLQGKIFIQNFNSAFGFIQGNGFKQNFDVVLTAKDLLKKPSLFLNTKLEIDMEEIFPGTDFLRIKGKELSQIQLSYNHTAGLQINIFNDLSNTDITSDIAYFNKPLGNSLDTKVKIFNIEKPNVLIQNNLFETLIILEKDKIGGYFKSGDYFNRAISSTKNFNKFKIYLDIPELNFEDINLDAFDENSSKSMQIEHVEFHFDELKLLGNAFNAQTGKISILGDATELTLKGNDLNGVISIGSDGFTKINLKDSKIKSLSLPKESRPEQFTNMRLIGKNINIEGIKIDSFDFYILENSEVITIDNIKVKSKIINVKKLDQEEKAYISYNKKTDLYKVKGFYELNKIPKKIKNFLGYDFEYLQSNVNVEWISAKKLNNLQGKLSFLVKDLRLEQEMPNSVLITALGIFNLKSFFSTLSEIDLSDENRSNLNINRGAGSFIFMKDRARISDPLFIETNFAKMKWIGDIQKDRKKNLSDLDLFLEMRLTISDNLPWYAAFLGGFPAVAGGMVIGSIFEDGINEISTINYQVKGDINNPELLRLE